MNAQQKKVLADYESGKWVPAYYGLKFTVARKTQPGSPESEQDLTVKVATFAEARKEASRRNH